MKSRYKFFIMGVAALMLVSPNFNPMPAISSSCPNVQFVFARGSGASLGGTEYMAFKNAIGDTLKKHLPTLDYDIYELGSSTQNGYQYPAISVEAPSVLLETYINAGKVGKFGASIKQGTRELISYIQSIAKSCSDTKFVLVGYSQGAMVISQTLPQLDADKIIYVATAGDPKLYLPEGYGANPAACLGSQYYSAYRANVPDCRTDRGILGALKPYQPSAYHGKLGAWCNSGDFMCGSYFDLLNQDGLMKPHISYSTNGSFVEMSQLITYAIAQYYPNSSLTMAKPVITTGPDVAFLIDTSNSMQFMFSKFPPSAISLATKVIQQGGRIALYEYRDLTDPFEARQLCDFSCTLPEFTRLLTNITLGGGGWTINESALSGALYVMNTLKWQAGVNKSIVLITDDGFKNPDDDGTTIQQVVRRSLEIDPVSIYTVTEPTYLPEEYSAITEPTGGYAYTMQEFMSNSDGISNRPVARLSQNFYGTMVGESLAFDASASTAADAPIIRYEWDLNGDEIYEFTTVEPIINHIYSDEFNNYIRVKVVDTRGHSSMMNARVVAANPANDATVSDLVALQNDKNIELSYRLQSAPLALIIVNDYLLGFTAKTNLVLTSMPSNCTITVIPISADGRQGSAASIALTDG